MKSWLQKLTRRKTGNGVNTGYTGGVDSGRDAIIQTSPKETRRKKNLLKKLNLYWSQKRSVSKIGYQDKVRTSNWRRKILLVTCLLGAALLFVKTDGVGTILRSLENLDYFRLTSIEIRGVSRASEAQIRSATGVTVSTSQFSIERDEIGAAIAAQNNWVRSVTISRYWPDKLIVRVTEHEPYALIARTNNGQASLYYLNRKGEPFVKIEHGMDLDYPIITGLETEQDQEFFQDKLKQPLYFLRLAEKNNPNLPAQSVSEIHIDREEGLILHLVEYPFPIFLGGEDIKKKYVMLRKILEKLYMYDAHDKNMGIALVTFIRLDYLKDKAIVGRIESG